MNTSKLSRKNNKENYTPLKTGERKHACLGLSSLASQDCLCLTTHARWSRDGENNFGAVYKGALRKSPCIFIFQESIEASECVWFSFHFVLFSFNISGKDHEFFGPK